MGLNHGTFLSRDENTIREITEPEWLEKGNPMPRNEQYKLINPEMFLTLLVGGDGKVITHGSLGSELLSHWPK